MNDRADKDIFSVRSTNGGVAFNWQAVSVVILLVSNIFALAWGAASLTAGLSSLRDTVAEVKGVVRLLSDQIGANAVRVGIVELKVDDLRDEVRSRKLIPREGYKR